MSICYNVDEKVKQTVDSRPGHCLCGVCSRPPGFPPTPQSWAREVTWSVKLPQSASVCGPLMEGCPVQSRCLLSFQEWLWPPVTSNWNKPVGKGCSYLFSFIFLNCVYSSHLFQCIIGVLEVGCCFCHQKYAVGTSLCFYPLASGDIGFHMSFHLNS